MSALLRREIEILEGAAFRLANEGSDAFRAWTANKIADALADALARLEQSGQLEHSEFVLEAHDQDADEHRDRLIESQAR